jgi:hypothetical protein
MLVLVCWQGVLVLGVLACVGGDGVAGAGPARPGGEGLGWDGVLVLACAVDPGWQQHC